MKKFYCPKLWVLVSLAIISCDPMAFASSNKKVADLLARASKFLCTTEYDKSVSTCNEALKIDPGCPAAYYVRGFARRYQNEYDLAIADFTQVIMIDPKYTAAYYGRGISYAYKGDYGSALMDLNKAISLNPDYTDAYFNRARIYYDIDEYDEAWADLHKAESLGVADDMIYRGFINKLRIASGRNQ